jgi:hypothetical protein
LLFASSVVLLSMNHLLRASSLLLLARCSYVGF